MRNGVWWLLAALALVIVLAFDIPAGPRTAQAVPKDVCDIVTWDSTGSVLDEGDVVGGDGSIYMVFRVEDDALGYLNDLLDGPVQDVIDEVLQELEDEDLTDEEREALEEVIRELEEALESFRETDLILIDSGTGSAGITSYAEVVNFEFVKPGVDHVLINAPGLLNQRVDHMFPEWFNDPDGHELDSIRAWLEQVAGVPVPSAVSDSASICGSSLQDGWGFVDMKCTAAGAFTVLVIPDRERSEQTDSQRRLVCPGQPDTAEIAASRSTLETQPVGSSSDESLITVTTYDAAGKNIDGAKVTFLTNNCTFTNPLAGAVGDFGITPAALGSTVTVWSDTDSVADKNFLSNNPLQKYAGTAEVMLECAKGTPGTATVTAIVTRPGADISLSTTITVVGPTSSTGLSLALSADSLECGEILLATATAVDANGHEVSDGTKIHFTTDTSSGIVGGQEGGQGWNTTIDGETTVTIAVAPNDAGIHTVIAYAVDKNGALLSQVSETFECTGAIAAAAPTVSAPATGTGTGSITPPSTGDGGLVGDGKAGSSLAQMVGALATFLTLAGFLAGRVCLYGRRR